MGLASVSAAIEQEALRLIQECLTNATREFWEKRALDFEAARPRPEDFHGSATPAELSERWRRLTGIAQACRARAAITEQPEAPEVDVVNVWRERGAA